MEDLIATAQVLVNYIKDNHVCDTITDDGDGHTNCSQSHTLKSLISNLQRVIDTSTGPGNIEIIQKLVRKGLLNTMGKTKAALEKAMRSLQ